MNILHNNQMKRIIISILLGLLLLPGVVTAEDDFQYWSQLSLTFIDTEKIDWYVFTDTRFTNDAQDISLYYVSNRVKYDFIKNLSFQTNYTYIQGKKNNTVASRSEMKFQHRAELEVNPYFNIGKLKFSNRNRVEFRWIEDSGAANTRFRSRLGLSYPLKWDRIPALTSIYTNTEFFYNHHEHTYDENRTVPVGLSWKISDKLALSTYYLIQSQKGSGKDWKSNHVLATTISYKF